MDTLIKKDIEKDFYNCIGAFKNICSLINVFPKLKINVTDSEEEKNIKQSQIDDLLVQLGRIGELAFKYLLKIKQIELYPNQNYEQFSKTEQIFTRGSIKDLVNKKKISQTGASEILSFKDDNDQKFHNFIYLGLIVRELMPETYKNFGKTFEYIFQSKSIMDVLKSMDLEQLRWEISYGNYMELVIFPCLIELDPIKIDDDKIKNRISEIKNKAYISGDIFTRLRYNSNNKAGKQFNVKDLNDIFIYMTALVTLIEGIHKNNDNLLSRPESINGRAQALKIHKLIGKSESYINSIFDEFSDDDPLYLCQKLFSGYEIEEIKKIEKKCKEYKLITYDVFELGISSEDLEKLHDSGLDDYVYEWDYFFDELGHRKSIEDTISEIQKENTMPNESSK